MNEQALSDATPPIGTIYPFTKMDVTFDTAMQFWCISEFRKFFNNYDIIYLTDPV